MGIGEKFQPRSNFLKFSKGENDRQKAFKGEGSVVERVSINSVLYEGNIPLTEDQKKELEGSGIITKLYDKTLPETEDGITQDDVLNAIERGVLPAGFSFERLQEFADQSDMVEDF